LKSKSRRVGRHRKRVDGARKDKVPVGQTPDILVLSLTRAEAYEPTRREVCISITNPKAPAARVSSRFAAVLRLCFTDIAGPSDVLFVRDHARAILDFLRQWPDAERIVIHCAAGLSRSPGVALGLCELHGWPTAKLEKAYPLWNTWVRAELVRAGKSDESGNS
jgi:hypothetical protein